MVGEILVLKWSFLKIPQGILSKIQVFCQVKQWVLSLLSIFPGLIGTWPLRRRRKRGRSGAKINTWLLLPPAFPELICSLWIPGIRYVARASMGEIWQNNIVWKERGALSGFGELRSEFESLSGHIIAGWFWAILPYLFWKPVFSLLTEVKP